MRWRWWVYTTTLICKSTKISLAARRGVRGDLDRQLFTLSELFMCYECATSVSLGYPEYAASMPCVRHERATNVPRVMLWLPWVLPWGLPCVCHECFGSMPRTFQEPGRLKGATYMFVSCHSTYRMCTFPLSIEHTKNVGRRQRSFLWSRSLNMFDYYLATPVRRPRSSSLLVIDFSDHVSQTIL